MLWPDWKSISCEKEELKKTLKFVFLFLAQAGALRKHLGCSALNPFSQMSKKMPQASPVLFFFGKTYFFFKKFLAVRNIEVVSKEAKMVFGLQKPSAAAAAPVPAPQLRSAVGRVIPGVWSGVWWRMLGWLHTCEDVWSKCSTGWVHRCEVHQKNGWKKWVWKVFMLHKILRFFFFLKPIRRIFGQG